MGGMTEILQQTPSDGTEEPSKYRLAYDRYIKSAKWDRRKLAYYAKYSKVCRACGTRREIHLHHHTYRRMRHELDEDLVPLCQQCHELCHKHHRDHPTWSLTKATGDFLRLNGATLRPAKKKKIRQTRRPKPVPPPPLKPGIITREEAAKILGVPVRVMPRGDSCGLTGRFRESTVKQWATSQPPKWLRKYRNGGTQPSSARPRSHSWYHGGGKPYSPEFQKLLDEAKAKTGNQQVG